MSDATCEWEECGREAWYEVNAQWSIVDFMSYQSCELHLHDFYDWLGELRVEGLEAAVWSTTFDIEAKG